MLFHFPVQFSTIQLVGMIKSGKNILRNMQC